MTAKGVEILLTTKLAQSLVSKGFFKKNKLLIAKRWNDAEDQIRCTARKDKKSGVIWVTLMLGIRFDAAEAVLGEDKGKDKPTLVTQLAYLQKNLSVDEWDAGSAETFTALLSLIEQHAIPFFEKFSTLRGTAYFLEGEKPEDLPFILHPVTRVCILAAIMAITKGKTAAIALLDQEIAKLQNKENAYEEGMRTRYQELCGRISRMEMPVMTGEM